MNFQPDYHNVLNAARNRESARLPLYEHIISQNKMAEIIRYDFTPLWNGDERDLNEYFRRYCGFFRDHGYDTVSFECCIGGILPGGGALGNPGLDPAIKTMEDFLAYPWDELCDRYFAEYGKYFRALRDNMPAGMKAVGGPGNGVFECVQDLTGYQNLCYIAVDDEELYAGLFEAAGTLSQQIWSRFMKEYGDIYCVLRFGDDLGFKSNSLLSSDDIRAHILPQYKKVIDIVHSWNKPFLLHSCGCIFNVMDDLIACGIDAKHSNEDQIAPFPEWVKRYGDRIGNFGGIDVDVLCAYSRRDLKEYILDVIRACEGCGGFAFGTGNSIPDYVPAQNYLNMVEIVREYRGDFSGD